jgi:hypothetical protein
MSDEEIVRLYDQQAQTTGLALGFYATELDRRDQARTNAISEALARAAVDLAERSYHEAHAATTLAVASLCLSLGVGVGAMLWNLSALLGGVSAGAGVLIALLVIVRDRR